MNKKQELIDYVIGNEFITKPSLQDKFTELLDEALAEQLILHGVVKSLKDKYTNEFWFWLERFNSEDDSNRLWWYKKDVMLSTEEMWQEYNRLKTNL